MVHPHIRYNSKGSPKRDRVKRKAEVGAVAGVREDNHHLLLLYCDAFRRGKLQEIHPMPLYAGRYQAHSLALQRNRSTSQR